MSEKLNAIKDCGIKDKRSNIIFADAMTYLFEEIAKLIVEHKPLLETYYGEIMFVMLNFHLIGIKNVL